MTLRGWHGGSHGMTSFRDILVHLDGGERDEARVAAAAALVRRFGGRLTGLFARLDHHPPGGAARHGSDLFEAAARASEDRFAATTSGLPTRFWRLAHGEAGHVLNEVVVCARVSDLVVIGQHHAGKDAPAELPETVIMASGRPCLVIPAVGEYPVIGNAVMVAWNGSREATRAVHDSMPLLEAADSVEVVTVRTGSASGDGERRPPLSVLDHLTTHGIRVTPEVLAGDDIGIMDLLLSRAFDHSADLLVMGAHAGLHLPFARGAGTRYILDHMTLPVLMSH